MRELSQNYAANSSILSWHQRKHIYKSGITTWHLFGEMYCNRKHVFSLFLCWFSLVYTAVTLYLPYFALHFTLNVRICREILTSELIDRGKKSEFYKTTKKTQEMMSQVSRKTPKRCQRDHRARNRVTDFFVDYISWSGRDLPAPRDVLLRSPANPSCPAYCSQVWDFSWGHLANNVNIIMITWSRSFFYSVNLAVQKVKTRERTKTAINISQRWIIPMPQLHDGIIPQYRFAVVLPQFCRSDGG